MNARVFFFARASDSAKTLSQGPRADGGVVESQKPRSSSVDRTLLRTELLPMRHPVLSCPGTPLQWLLRRSLSTVLLHQQFSFDSLKTTTSIFKSIVFVSVKSLLLECSLESVTPFVLCRRAWRVSRRQTLTASCLNSTSSFSDRLHPHLHSGPHEEDDNKTIVEIIRQCLVRDVKLVKPQLDFGEQLSTLVQYSKKKSHFFEREIKCVMPGWLFRIVMHAHLAFRLRD